MEGRPHTQKFRNHADKCFIEKLLGCFGPAGCLHSHSVCSLQKSNDDYYAEARVRLVLPDSLRLEKLQGTVRLTNLNNKQSFTTSTFQAGEASLEVFRGVYAVDVEGSVRYATPDGTNQTANFRASTPYIKVLDHPSLVSLDIILM